VHAFTIGQRRGLGVALGRPAWVRAIDPVARRVLVTTDPTKLGALGLEAHRAVFAAPPVAGRVRVRVRHRGDLAPAHLHPVDAERFRVVFDAPVRAVAPGQAAVVYDGDTVLGGGTITRALTDLAA
jgi:tRNA-specific 2-thiouridylase